MLTHKDEQLLKLGRMVMGMINDVNVAPASDTAYGRRRITFPGGAAEIFIVRGAPLADAFDATATREFNVVTVTPNSQTN